MIIVAYDGAGGQLEHYDLGVAVPPELREAWRSSLDVTLVHRPADGPEVSRTVSSYPLALPNPGQP